MKRTFWVSCGLAIVALGLAGCDTREEPAAEPTQAQEAAPAATPAWSDPDAPAGISVSDGRLTLPAVAGNPGAVYFTIRNTGGEDLAIRSAWVAGAAMAMLHQTRTENGTARMADATDVPVPAGNTVSFAPGGLHLMAMDLGGTLEEGGQTEVTLTFASGDKVSFPVEVRAPGDAGAPTGE